MKRIIILLMCMQAIAACSQNKKAVMETKPESTVKKLRNYDKPSQYSVFITSNNCSWQLLINDAPIYSYNAGGGVRSVIFDLNSDILKSGKQKLKVVLYPARKLDNSGYFEVLRPNTYMQFKLIHDKSDDGDYKTILEYDGELEEVNGMQLFSKPGLPTYTIEREFEAKVPYEVKGWSESQQLDTMDREKLEKEVVAYFQQLWELFDEKKKDEIVALTETKVNERNFALQRLESEKKEEIKLLFSSMDNPTFVMRPLEPDMYKMVFYGDGKMVGLQCTSQLYRGKPALYGIYIREQTDGRKRKRKTHYPMLLHKPKGSDKLEIIR
ncbi:MAG: hypothetical protein ACK5IQ_06060 [Bacteroidales bacterium]